MWGPLPAFDLCSVVKATLGVIMACEVTVFDMATGGALATLFVLTTTLGVVCCRMTA